MKKPVEEKAVNENIMINPNKKMFQLNEKINKEMTWYRQWSNQEDIKNRGYMGHMYKLNDPTKQVMITQKVCHVTPNQPFVKMPKDNTDKSYENVI